MWLDCVAGRILGREGGNPSLRFIVLIVATALSACGEDPRATPPVGSIRALNVPSRESGANSVTESYGPLIVSEGEYEAESGRKPWSSWWYPIKDDYLFASKNGRAAPLAKYDDFIKNRYGKNGKAAEFERRHLYDPQAGNWEGLCDAWAKAALLEPEPVRPIRAGRIEFSVGDLKALLVKTYEETPGIRVFGQRYDGNRVSVFDDLYPDQFHRFVQVELFEHNRSFVMDKDPGIAVWNTPIWKVHFSIKADAIDERILHVNAWLWGGSPFVSDYDFVGTLGVSFVYSYDLIGWPIGSGNFEIAYGEWTGESRDYHPDFVTSIAEVSEHRSRNREIDGVIVQEIVNFRD